MKPTPGFLNHLAQARGPGTGSQEPRALDHRAGTRVLPSALPELSWSWMVLLGPWTNGRGLLCLIAKFEIRDNRPHPPIIRPRVLDHGPLILAL